VDSPFRAAAPTYTAGDPSPKYLRMDRILPNFPLNLPVTMVTTVESIFHGMCESVEVNPLHWELIRVVTI
jgi:hypothetical protein